MIGDVLKAILAGFMGVTMVFFFVITLLHSCAAIVEAREVYDVRPSNDRTVEGMTWPYGSPYIDMSELGYLNSIDPEDYANEQIQDRLDVEGYDRCVKRNNYSLFVIKKIDTGEDPEAWAEIRQMYVDKIEECHL